MFNRNDENYIYELVSKNIRKIRKEKGLTQEQLATKMDYSIQFISNIERKKHQTFSLGTLWKLALVFDIDIVLLFKEEDTKIRVMTNKIYHHFFNLYKHLL